MYNLSLKKFVTLALDAKYIFVPPFHKVVRLTYAALVSEA